MVEPVPRLPKRRSSDEEHAAHGQQAGTPEERGRVVPDDIAEQDEVADDPGVEERRAGAEALVRLAGPPQLEAGDDHQSVDEEE